MACGIVYVIYLCAVELYRSRFVGILAAFLVATMPPFVYHAKTANLDVPYLFWFSLSLLYYVRAVLHGRNLGLRPLGHHGSSRHVHQGSSLRLLRVTRGASRLASPADRSRGNVAAAVLQRPHGPSAETGCDSLGGHPSRLGTTFCSTLPASRSM